MELAGLIGMGEVVLALARVSDASNLHVYTGGVFRSEERTTRPSTSSWSTQNLAGVSRLPVVLVGTGRAIDANSGQSVPVFLADPGLGQQWGHHGLLAVDATSSGTLEVLQAI
jgi:hypothetical protein